MEGYSRWAKGYDSTWNTLIATEELYSLGLLDSLTGEAALDVGAGTGRFALKLARRGWKVTALDPNPEMLAIAGTSRSQPGPSHGMHARGRGGWPAGGGRRLRSRGLRADAVSRT